MVDQIGTAFQNEYDEYLSYKTPNNFALVGVLSFHSNFKE